MKSAAQNLVIVLVTAALALSRPPSAAGAPPTFGSEKTRWHGFDRYDFLTDEADLSVKPYKAAPDEGNAVRTQVKGQLRCVIVAPKEAAPGNAWSWRGYYFDHEPQTEVELLRRGFHVGFIWCDAGKPWDAWYAFLTEKHGLSKTPVLEGAGGAAGEAYAWAIEDPDKVSCVYAENPILRSHMTKAQPLDRLDVLAKAGVPLLHVCGSRDPWLDTETRAIEKRYKELGGPVTVIVQEGMGHFPTAPRDPKPVVEFIVARQAARESQPKRPPTAAAPLAPAAQGIPKPAEATPVRAQAREWRIDPDRIGIMGLSAGAEPAAPAANLESRAVSPGDESACLLSKMSWGNRHEALPSRRGPSGPARSDRLRPVANPGHRHQVRFPWTLCREPGRRVG